jgi:hypothetical protein
MHMCKRQDDGDDTGDEPGSGGFPIGLPDDVFRRLMSGIGEGQEGIAVMRVREYEQVSLQEAASHACIKVGYLWRIEHGQRHARARTLINVCLASLSLSVPQTNYILGLSDFGLTS